MWIMMESLESRKCNTCTEVLEESNTEERFTSESVTATSIGPYCQLFGPECEDQENTYEDLDNNKDEIDGWAQTSKLWKCQARLKVYFYHMGPSLPTAETILDWARKWNRKSHNIPTFVHTYSMTEADIRVSFESGRCWSKVGTDARKKNCIGSPTMNLSLNNLSPDFQRYLVIHEFGHALGLEHEHQRSDFWKVACKFLDIKKMKSDERMVTVDLDSDMLALKSGGKVSAYDPDSVMHYWFDVNWLKREDYMTLKGINSDRHTTNKEKETLRGIFKRNRSYADGPSEMDLQFLHNCYDGKSR